MMAGQNLAFLEVKRRLNLLEQQHNSLTSICMVLAHQIRNLRGDNKQLDLVNNDLKNLNGNNQQKQSTQDPRILSRQQPMMMPQQQQQQQPMMMPQQLQQQQQQQQPMMMPQQQQQQQQPMMMPQQLQQQQQQPMLLPQQQLPQQRSVDELFRERMAEIQVRNNQQQPHDIREVNIAKGSKMKNLANEDESGEEQQEKPSIVVAQKTYARRGRKPGSLGRGKKALAEQPKMAVVTDNITTSIVESMN